MDAKATYCLCDSTNKQNPQLLVQFSVVIDLYCTKALLVILFRSLSQDITFDSFLIKRNSNEDSLF